MRAADSNPLHVDALFGTLPARREDRWELLKRFFAGWFGPLTPTDGFAAESIRAAEERLQIALPAALREWYALAGRRKEVWSCQDHFREPDTLGAKDDKLVFLMENQDVVRWAISVESSPEDDPQVFVSDPDDWDDWIEQASVSAFALLQMLTDVKFSGTTLLTANASAPKAAMAALGKSFRRLDFPDLHWPAFPTRFYGGTDLVIETHGDTWIWVSGKSPTTFRAATDLLEENGVVWEQISDE